MAGRRQQVATVDRSTRSPRARRPKAKGASIGGRLLSLGAMIFAGALAVGMSVPANAFGPIGGAEPAVAEVAPQRDDLQSVAVASTVDASSTARDAYSVTSWAEMLVLKYGTHDYNWDPSNSGPIRWPFPVEVKISSGFGERAAPCSGCSSMHMGLDFQPPNDSPIYAIADGVVVEHSDDAYGFGNHVIIDHGNLLGDGVDVQTLYAHMQHTSVPLNVGDVIHVGDFIGLVGRTGTATGIHLHFEVHLDGVQVDPFAWLQHNTGAAAP
jgi:murein DD-endopeptidase MepM/ murein hydrolase activator NlpD